MKLLTAQMKMADAIHSNYLLIPVVHRFGVHLGFGEKTIDEVCADHSIDTDFFLAIINAFSNENYFPEKKLQTFNVLTIVEYLKKTHAYYRDTQIPVIEKSLGTLLTESPKQEKSLRLVKKFFLEYKNELLTHLRQEEKYTFPYVEEVYRLYSGEGTPSRKKSALQYSMKIYEEEHDEIDEKLFDLKNILIKYIGGEYDESACATIVFELFRLERDVKDHARIENNILMPMVAEMEKSLKRRAG